MGFCTGRWTGISWTICIQSAPRSRWITTPTPHDSIFTGPMLLLATFCGLSACTPAGHIAGLYFPHGSSAPHTGCCTFLKLSWQHVRRSIYRRQSFQVRSLGQSSRGKCCYLWRVPEFPFSIMWDGWKEAHMPKTSSIRSAVSIELRLVTDTDRRTDTVKLSTTQPHASQFTSKKRLLVGTARTVSGAGSMQPSGVRLFNPTAARRCCRFAAVSRARDIDRMLHSW